MPALLRVAAALCLLVGAAGCSETTFENVVGNGKDAPDERQVRTNQALVLPPDLTLKAPGTGAPPPPPPQPVQMTASTATTQPPNYGAPAPGTTTASLTPAPAPVTAAAPAAPGAAPTPGATPAPGGGAAPATQAAANQDVYARYGISKTKPDGTPKKPAELREELRQKYIEMQRAKNPNYGTILNMGSVWSDQ